MKEIDKKELAEEVFAIASKRFVRGVILAIAMSILVGFIGVVISLIIGLQELEANKLAGLFAILGGIIGFATGLLIKE